MGGMQEGGAHQHGHHWQQPAVLLRLTWVPASCSADPAVPPTAPEICERAGNQTLAAQQEQMEGVAALVLGRLAPAAATSDAALTAALDRLRMGSPELHAVVAASFGKNVSQPAAASAATLAAFYEDPLPTPAKAALSGRSIAASGMTAAMLVARCEARLAEIEAAASAAAARPEVVEAAALTAPGGALPYNYSAWDGGARSYTSCNLRRWEAGASGAGQGMGGWLDPAGRPLACSAVRAQASADVLVLPLPLCS